MAKDLKMNKIFQNLSICEFLNVWIEDLKCQNNIKYWINFEAVDFLKYVPVEKN